MFAVTTSGGGEEIEIHTYHFYRYVCGLLIRWIDRVLSANYTL